MGIGVGLGAFAQGLASGLKTSSDLQDARQRRELAIKQDSRADADAAWQEETRAEARRQREAQQKFAAEIEQIRKDAESGTNGFDQFGYTAPQPSVGPDGQPQQPKSNPFRALGDGLYQNQRGADSLIAQRRAEALERLYSSTGQADKIVGIRNQVLGELDKDTERKIKSALSGAAIGAPGSLDALSRVYDYMNNGEKLNPKSGTWDANAKTWRGVEFVGPDGKTSARDITQADLLGVALQDPAKFAAFNIEQNWKNREFGLKDRSVAADERRAGAAEKSANTNAAELEAKKPLIEAQAGYYNRRGDADSEKDRVDRYSRALSNAFPLYGKEFDAQKLLASGMKADEIKQYGERYKIDHKGYNTAVALAGLNPSTDPKVVAGLSKELAMGKARLEKQVDESGRKFVVYGGTKIFVE